MNRFEKYNQIDNSALEALEDDNLDALKALKKHYTKHFDQNRLDLYFSEAAYYVAPKCAAWLLEQGAVPDAEGVDGALHQLCSGDNAIFKKDPVRVNSFLQLLFKQGVELNVFNQNGLTPLGVCVEQHLFEAALQIATHPDCDLTICENQAYDLLDAMADQNDHTNPEIQIALIRAALLKGSDPHKPALKGLVFSKLFNLASGHVGAKEWDTILEGVMQITQDNNLLTISTDPLESYSQQQLRYVASSRDYNTPKLTTALVNRAKLLNFTCRCYANDFERIVAGAAEREAQGLPIYSLEELDALATYNRLIPGQFAEHVKDPIFRKPQHAKVIYDFMCECLDEWKHAHANLIQLFEGRAKDNAAARDAWGGRT